MSPDELDTTLLCEHLFDVGHALVAILDRDLRFIRVNHAYAARMNRAPDTLVGAPLFELFPNPDTERLVRLAIENGQRLDARDQPMEATYRPGAGTEYWDTSLRPLRSTDGRVTAVLLVLVDVTDHVAALRLAREREVLLRELHHRVKNNLQVVSGILREAKRKGAFDAAAIDATLGRISTISHIHDLVGAAPSLDCIELGRYARAIATELESLHARDAICVRVIGTCQAPLDVAGPIGMILHELLTNAFQHAFPTDASGTVTIEVRCHEDGFTLEVCDDGVGLPDGGERTLESTGLELVLGLSRQINGEFTSHALTPRGTCCHLRVPRSVATL